MIRIVPVALLLPILSLCNQHQFACTRSEPIVPQEMVVGADAIVIGTAIDYAKPSEPTKATFPPPLTPLRFRVDEILKGQKNLKQIELVGYFVESDDYNDAEPPYSFVRPSGRMGGCWSYQYKKEGRYLLFLSHGKAGIDLYPDPLAPVNEQLHPGTDPWLTWVRGVLDGLATAEKMTGKRIDPRKLKPKSPMSMSGKW